MRIRNAFIVTALGIPVFLVGCAPGGSAAKRMVITAENNPTTKAGRGDPSLDDPSRPAAWILIDGKCGTFKEEDGHKLLQWFVEKPVGTSPTFRVEAFEDLVQEPVQFKCVLQTRDESESPRVSYGIAANEGAFELGHEYSLLKPGDGFSIRDSDGKEVPEIKPLPPGQYLLAGSIVCGDGAQKTVAVTYFDVGG